MGNKLLYGWLGLLIVIIIVSASFLTKYYHTTEPWEVKDAIPWGLLVPGYAYFAVIAAGSSIINSLYSIFGYKGEKEVLERVTKHNVWFSLMAVIPAWVMILLDLGRVDNFLWLLKGFNVLSRIAWMGALYVVYFIFELIELIYLIRSEVNEKLKHWKALELTIAILVIIVTVSVYSNLGEVFGASTGVPGWYGPHVGAFFLATGVVVAAAWLSIYMSVIFKAKGQYNEAVNWLVTKLYNKIILVALPIVFFFVFWSAMISYYYPPAWEMYKQLLYGYFKTKFWVIEIFFGMFIAYLLAIYGYVKRSFSITILNAFILIISGFTSIYMFVISGEIARLSFADGAPLANLNPYYLRFWPFHYEIGTPEKMMFVLAVSIWLLLLTLGEMWLPLERGEKPRRLWVFK
jgi:Ni/Fe-hydrogenase subunit HybB-like protein